MHQTLIELMIKNAKIFSMGACLERAMTFGITVRTGKMPRVLKKLFPIP